MNLDFNGLRDLESKGYYREVAKRKDRLGINIAVGDVLVVKDEQEFEESAYVAFIYKGEWYVHPLFDLNIQAYEGLNGIKYAERNNGAGFLTLELFMVENEIKEFGNIFEIQQFAEYIVSNNDYKVFEKEWYKWLLKN